MDLSIVIVNWNTRALLRECLTSLADATADMSTEVFVVDNASGDGSADMVRKEFSQYCLIESGGNIGFSRASNLALRQAEGRTLLLLNPDTLCPPRSLARLCSFLDETPDSGVVGPTLVDDRFRPIITYGNFPATRYHWLGCLDPRRVWLPRPLRMSRFARIPEPGATTRPVDYVAGACLLIRRETLAKIGLLDERFFMYFEETDWCWRVWRAGYKVYHCADVSIVHLEGRAAKQVSAFSLVQFQRSYRQFVAKNYGQDRVRGFRTAQFVEYFLKGMWRWLAPTQRTKNRAMAKSFFTIARLQLQKTLDVQPPG